MPGGALAQLPEKAAILAKIGAEHLRHGDDVLAVWDGGQGLLGHPVLELENPFLMAAGTQQGQKKRGPAAGDEAAMSLRVLIGERV